MFRLTRTDMNDSPEAHPTIFIQNPDTVREWAAVFHAWTLESLMDPRLLDSDRKFAFLSWGESLFGPIDYSFDVREGFRWSCVSGGMNCYVFFRDPSDAMLFKLRWVI